MAQNAPKTRRIRSGAKGKRHERELCRLLADRFGKPFSRTIGSGNRWGQVRQMPQHAKDTFTGDVVCPEDFRFALECKGGYDDVDLFQALAEGNAQLDEFLDQALAESNRSGRIPLLAWRQSRKPWLAFVRRQDMPGTAHARYLYYGGWMAVPLVELLQAPDSYFFSGADS